jgi:predicted nucleic acid-binding protein
LRLYLEPSVLVKLFKNERDSAKMIEVIGAIDSKREWFGCTSSWSALEVARALKKDGKPKELIELNLKELRRHRIAFVGVTRAILEQSEKIVASRNIYASDAVHSATYAHVLRKLSLDGMLSDDRHLQRLRNLVPVITLDDVPVN